MARRVAASTTLWEATPPLLQQQSGFAREVTTAAKGTAHAYLGAAAIYPMLAGIKPYLSTICDLLKLTKNCEDCTEFDSFLLYY